MERIENLHDRPLAEMKPGETLYAQRSIRGYNRTFFGKFVGICRGFVEILGQWQDEVMQWKYPGDRLERFRVDRCYLWGKERDGLARWPRCHWFRNGKKERAQ